jgi:uncharacterized protein YdhG (YjbR/CyaY superfamily)
MKANQARTIDEYIADFPEDIQKLLEKVREAIKKTVPEAGETIKYGIPTFTLKGNLVHFAAYKNHIGFYPAPREAEEFKKELSAYEGGKGTVQFPLDKPLPLALIKKMVKFRVKKQLESVKLKVKKRKRA